MESIRIATETDLPAIAALRRSVGVADEPHVAGALLSAAAPLASGAEAIGVQLPGENVAGIGCNAIGALG
jgi:hypothetical protein